MAEPPEAPLDDPSAVSPRFPNAEVPPLGVRLDCGRPIPEDMSMKYLAVAVVPILLLSCDSSPTSPGDELVGTWVLVSATDSDGIVMVLRADGTFRQSFEVEGLEIAFTGSWEIVGDKLVTIFDAIAGEVQTFSEGYTIRGNRLTLVDDEDGSVEIWERRE